MNALHTSVLLSLSIAGTAVGLSAGAATATATAMAPCEARDVGFDRKEVGWKHQPLSKLKRDTVYTLAKEGSRSVLRGSADGAASLFVAALKPVASTGMTLAWEWKTDALVPGADNRDKSLEDAPLRVLAAFDGDKSTLPEAEQTRFKRAKSLSGREPPFAVLMYLWTDHVPVGTVIPSAHTGQLKMLAVASGAGGLGSWQAVKRNLADDYRRAYGTEPGPLLGVAVMTDTDNTRTKAVGEYSGLRIACNGG